MSVLKLHEKFLQRVLVFLTRCNLFTGNDCTKADKRDRRHFCAMQKEQTRYGVTRRTEYEFPVSAANGQSPCGIAVSTRIQGVKYMR